MFGYMIGTYADDTLGTDKLDEAVLNGTLGVALSIGLDVSQVTDVASLGSTVTVCLAMGVD